LRKNLWPGTSPGMDALALLKLQIEWGADEALEDAPIDRLQARQRAGPVPLARPAVVSSTPAAAAEALAAGATTLGELRAAIETFDGCALRQTATSLVFNDGNPGAPVMLIGEAPSADDDRAGKAFAGRLGGLLDRMLSSIGLDRSGVLLAPLIPWRPPGDRPPSELELAACLPFTRRHIALAKPRFLLLLGSLAARALLSPTLSPTWRRSRATWTEMPRPDGEGVLSVMVMPALGTIARDAAAREQAWAALRQVRRALDRA
jgi:uracil-DNA glycosylase family 4